MKATTNHRNIGNKLTIILASRGLSQTKFAMTARQRVTKLCATSKWHSATIHRVANALKAPVSVFFQNGRGSL